MKEKIEDIKESIRDNIGVVIFFAILLILWGFCVYVKIQDPNAYKSDIKRLQEQVDSLKTILNERQ